MQFFATLWNLAYYCKDIVLQILRSATERNYGSSVKEDRNSTFVTGKYCNKTSPTRTCDVPVQAISRQLWSQVLSNTDKAIFSRMATQMTLTTQSNHKPFNSVYQTLQIAFTANIAQPLQPSVDIYLIIYLSVCLFVRPSVHPSVIYQFLRSFVHSFIHSFIYYLFHFFSFE